MFRTRRMTMPLHAAPIDEPCRCGLPSPRIWSLQTTDFDELASGFPGWDMRPPGSR